jgi:hypothetical protein
VPGRHHPSVSKDHSGRWIVHCPQCLSLVAVPMGIEEPLRSRELAERVSRTHEAVGFVVRLSASRPLVVQTDPAELAA